MRGGDPSTDKSKYSWAEFYPHARGWSWLANPCKLADGVLPACAGVIPDMMQLQLVTQRFTRMRGGVPVYKIKVFYGVKFCLHMFFYFQD